MYVLGMTPNITMELNAESLAIRNSFCAVPDIQDLIWSLPACSVITCMEMHMNVLKTMITECGDRWNLNVLLVA